MARAGGYVAHLGATLIFISILAQSGSEQVKVEMDLGRPIEVMGMTMVFQGWTVPANPADSEKQAVVVDVIRNGRTIRTYPRMYQVFANGQWMTRTEPYIHRSAGGDLYLAPAQYVPRTDAHISDPNAPGGTLTLEVSTKPLMSLLWMGILITVFGGLTATWRRYREFRESG
jgi:cytochrome c biogenesis factor